MRCRTRKHPNLESNVNATTKSYWKVGSKITKLMSNDIPMALTFWLAFWMFQEVRISVQLRDDWTQNTMNLFFTAFLWFKFYGFVLSLQMINDSPNELQVTITRMVKFYAKKFSFVNNVFVPIKVGPKIPLTTLTI